MVFPLLPVMAATRPVKDFLLAAESCCNPPGYLPPDKIRPRETSGHSGVHRTRKALIPLLIQLSQCSDDHHAAHPCRATNRVRAEGNMIPAVDDYGVKVKLPLPRSKVPFTVRQIFLSVQPVSIGLNFLIWLCNNKPCKVVHKYQFHPVQSACRQPTNGGCNLPGNHT